MDGQDSENESESTGLLKGGLSQVFLDITYILINLIYPIEQV